MNARTRAVFFEIHSDLPRQGPGGAASTGRAFSSLTGLPPRPAILDIGCGPGAQTLDLARLTDGSIVAVDNHQPYLDVLEHTARLHHLADRIQVVQADMRALDLGDARFDLIWAEGSIYIIGFENGLASWKPLLKERGYLAATEATWLRPHPPRALKAFWDEAYPAMQNLDGNLAIIRRAGYRVIGHFTLPESAWWDAYYTPLEQRLDALRNIYRGDYEALAVVEATQQEIDLYRTYAAYYGYVFYITEAC